MLLTKRSCKCLFGSIEDNQEPYFLKRNMLPPRALSCARIIAELYICLDCLTSAVIKHHNQVNGQKTMFNWATAKSSHPDSQAQAERTLGMTWVFWSFKAYSNNGTHSNPSQTVPLTRDQANIWVYGGCCHSNHHSVHFRPVFSDDQEMFFMIKNMPNNTESESLISGFLSSIARYSPQPWIYIMINVSEGHQNCNSSLIDKENRKLWRNEIRHQRKVGYTREL